MGKSTSFSPKGEVSMQTWPSHHCPPNPSAKASKKSRKFIKGNYTALEYGTVGAATLVQSGARFEWEPLVSSRPASKYFFIFTVAIVTL